MVEIRIHGRGGQGGVTLAKLIATSRFLEGQSVQAFGLYAAERSGAPVQAFCRFDDQEITDASVLQKLVWSQQSGIPVDLPKMTLLLRSGREVTGVLREILEDRREVGLTDGNARVSGLEGFLVGVEGHP